MFDFGVECCVCDCDDFVVGGWMVVGVVDVDEKVEVLCCYVVVFWVVGGIVCYFWIGL